MSTPSPQPGPALTHPLATSMAFDTSTCPWISGQSKFPHWKDTGGSRLCDLLSASHPDSLIPGGVEVADPKPCSGKTGSAPSCHPPAPPSAVGLAAAKAPAGIWALTSPEGSHPTPRGHLRVEKRGGLGGKAGEGEADGGSKSGSVTERLACSPWPGAPHLEREAPGNSGERGRPSALPSSASSFHPVSSRLLGKPGFCPFLVPFHFLIPKPDARERRPAKVSEWPPGLLTDSIEQRWLETSFLKLW